MNSERIDPRATIPKPQVAADGTRKIDVEALLGGAREIVIVHNEEHYRLRLTQNGKLILTK